MSKRKLRTLRQRSKFAHIKRMKQKKAVLKKFGFKTQAELGRFVEKALSTYVKICAENLSEVIQKIEKGLSNIDK